MNSKRPIYLFRSTIRILLIVACTSILTNIYAQYNNKLDKANDLYKAKRYAEAIPIYEEILDKDFNKSALLKLGRSHRQINNLEEALGKFEILMQQPEVKPENHLEFVELLIMNGDYKEAKQSLSEVTSIESTIHDIFRLTSMINNNYDLMPMYEDVHLEPFLYNTSYADENSPYLLEDRIVFTSDQSPNSKIKGKSGLTGRAYYKIWEANKVDDGSYAKPTTMTSSINATNKNTANAFFDTAHGEVYFTKNDNKKDRKDFYNMQLYRSQLKKEKYGKVEKLAVNTSEYNFMHPCLSADGNTLLFVANKPGQGGTDIFISKRTDDGWSRSKNIGDIINTAENEGYPFLDPEGNLYFCSKGHSGLGGYDIYFAKKNSKGDWDAPVNLGRPFNSQHDDISIFFGADGASGAFTSSRSGSDDIFLFHIETN